MSQLLFIQAYNNLFSILVCKSKGMTFHVEFLINLIPVGEVRRPSLHNEHPFPTSKKLITCKLGCIYTIDASVKKRTNKLRDSSQRLNYNIPKPFFKIKEPPILEAYGKNKRLKERQRLLVNSRPFSISIFIPMVFGNSYLILQQHNVTMRLGTICEKCRLYPQVIWAFFLSNGVNLN